MYSESVSAVAPFSIPIPWGKCNYSNVLHRIEGNFEWDDIYTDRYETRLELLTGGELNSTREALFYVSVGATAGSGQGIPPGQLSVLGKTPVAGGYIYKKLSDNQKVDATVTAPGDCYTFGASVFKDWLTIRRNGEDITDKTNVVWVGEKIALECTLYFGIATITNYQWTVPGIRIAYWDAREQFARTFALTYTNQPTIDFYWVQDILQAVVQCTVQVEGETLTAKTKFEVRRPEATWNLNPPSLPVKVTSNCVPTDSVYAGYYHLTTGKKADTGMAYPGMYYSYEITDLKGFTNAYSVSMVQTVAIDLQANLEDPTPQAQSWTVLAAGLDTSYPYVNWGYDPFDDEWDTPRNVLLDGEKYYWRRDQFGSYLMWKSERTSSIPVPLKLRTWDWRGAAEKLDRATPPTWRLNGWTNPQGGAGWDYYIHPRWETNVTWELLTERRTTNNYAYPTP